ncbi:MAG TPA: HPr family phosphocarrier protein [Ktedonobacterales bacterium]
MVTVEVTLHHEAGLHARPAALFVKTASRFAAVITVINGAKSANAKSIVQVLTLGAKQGTTVTITAGGEDEQAAVQALADLVRRNFEVV